MRRIYFTPYKLGSASCKALAQELGLKRLSTNKSWGARLRPRTFINWGAGSLNSTYYKSAHKILNKPDAVRIAVNKISALNAMQRAGVSTVPFTTSRDEANRWLSEKYIVIARNRINASGGEGIEVIRSAAQPMPYSPLFTKYIRKAKEYRVHVFMGRIIDVVQKKKSLGEENDPNSFIRSHGNGWVFCREGVVAPPALIQQALLAVSSLGLDFGAVDVLWSEVKAQAFVLEVNTAMGLQGTTLVKYKEAINGYINSIESASTQTRRRESWR